MGGTHISTLMLILLLADVLSCRWREFWISFYRFDADNNNTNTTSKNNNADDNDIHKSP